jgi:hypothetical protein
VRLVESIVWERCASGHEARFRKNELLRLNRPKFNKTNKAAWKYGGDCLNRKRKEPPFQA